MRFSHLKLWKTRGNCPKIKLICDQNEAEPLLNSLSTDFNIAFLDVLRRGIQSYVTQQAEEVFNKILGSRNKNYPGLTRMHQ